MLKQLQYKWFVELRQSFVPHLTEIVKAFSEALSQQSKYKC